MGSQPVLSVEYTLRGPRRNRRWTAGFRPPLAQDAGAVAVGCHWRSACPTPRHTETIDGQMGPFPGMDAMISVAAYGDLVTLEEYNDDTIVAFVADH